METLDLHETIDRLPPELQQLVAAFVAGLQAQQPVQTNLQPSKEEITIRRLAGFGAFRAVRESVYGM